MQIMNITTPANFYHAIRRQFTYDFRIPMVFFTPKKLLRYPLCVSKLEDFGPGTKFQEVIDDPYVTTKQVKKVLVCTGKIYYDLLEEQQENKRKDVAILRLEQIYPLPANQLRALIAKYPKTAQWSWVQEEPRNMGAWNYILRVLTEVDVNYIGRKPSPSPATGYHHQHAHEQQQIVNEAFGKVEQPA